MTRGGRPAAYPGYPSFGFSGKSPTKVKVLGRTHPVASWRDVLLRTCDEVRRARGKDFHVILGLRGSKRLWFSKNPAELHDPVEIDKSGTYAEMNLNAEGIVRLSRHVLALFGFEPDLDISTL